MTHIEDVLILEGNSGIENIISYLKQIISWFQGNRDNLNITVKYDGSPAIVFGIHPVTGEFFISTKSFFNKKKVLCAYTKEDIEKQFTEAIHEPLWQVLNTFTTTLYPAGIWQADILYTPDVLQETSDFFTFRHNTLEYKVKKNSQIGREVKNCSIGLAVHTMYEHSDDTYSASFGKKFIDMGNIIWQPPMEPFLSTPLNHHKVMNLVSLISKLELKATRLFDFYDLLGNEFANPKKWQEEIMKAINRRIANAQSVYDFTSLWNDIKMTMWSEYVSKRSFDATDSHNPCNKIETLEKNHLRDIEKWFQWYFDVMKMKVKIITLLQSMVYHPGLRIELDGNPTQHEGFVVSSNTSTQWVVKLVNRQEFSKANFNNNKHRLKK